LQSVECCGLRGRCAQCRLSRRTPSGRGPANGQRFRLIECLVQGRSPKRLPRSNPLQTSPRSLLRPCLRPMSGVVSRPKEAAARQHCRRSPVARAPLAVGAPASGQSRIFTRTSAGFHMGAVLSFPSHRQDSTPRIREGANTFGTRTRTPKFMGAMALSPSLVAI